MYNRSLLALVAILSGCATISEKCCPPTPPPIGFVTTGGRYCVAHSLPIPTEGLTLGQAVAASLRLRPEAPVQFSGLHSGLQRQRSASRELPIGLKVVTIDWADDAFKNLITGGEDNVVTALKTAVVSKPNYSNDQWLIIEPQIRMCCRRAMDRGILPVGEDLEEKIKDMPPEERNSERSRQNTALLQFKDECVASLIFGLLWQADASPEDDAVTKVERMIEVTVFPGIDTAQSASDQQLQSERKLLVESCLDRALAKGELRISTDGSHFRNAVKLLFEINQTSGSQQIASVPSNARDLTTVQNESTTLEEELIVTLSRPNARLISAPLWLVREYSAGDIILSPDDHVEVTAFSQTTVGSPLLQPSDGNILALGPMFEPEISTIQALTRMPASFENFVQTRGGGMADVVVIRRVELSGHLHDFVLPIPRPELYENSAAASDMLRQVKLQPGDQINLEVLDLTPMIRESRRMSQQASQIAIVAAAAAEADARRSWLQKKFVIHQEHKQKVCAQINSQTELVTGVNPAQLATLTGDFHDHLSAQVGMTP